LSKDEKLCEEIDADARKRYVGKVAEARATKRFANNPEPCPPQIVSLAVVIFVILVIGIFYRSGHPADAGADGSSRRGAAPSVQRATFKDVRTTVELINKMTKLADGRCEKSGACGFSAQTSDRSADPATDNVYRLSYSPRNDDAQHWLANVSLTRQAP
jgi:hypothetical protein